MGRGKFNVGDKVETVTGAEGKVTATDPARGIVAVKATNDSMSHGKGQEKVYRENEVRSR